MVLLSEPFPRLPEELVKLVLEWACEPTSSKLSSAVPADVDTLLSLLLVSRATYNLLVPRLYRSVTISKPSQLIAFTSTLLHRPSLGLLIRNLWVGSLDMPLHSLPIIISNNIQYAVAAKNHIIRREEENNGKSITQDLSPYKECHDIVYLEHGAEFAAMHVQSLPTQLTQPRPLPFQESVHDYWTNLDAWSSTSSAPFGGFGVDRESAGYDAAGDWIGMDEWMLRCIELQNMIEFHWEWIAATCPRQSIDTSGDDEAMAQDPIDWDDASQPPSPLPSVIRRDREVSLGKLSTSIMTDGSVSNLSHLGFDHLSRFSMLRQQGHSPRSAAMITIDDYLCKMGQPPRQAGLFSTLELLQDLSESDHFSSPALFARSGAIDNILGCEPPEGENAPPNAIPASSAVFTSFGGSTSTSDEESDGDEAEAGNRRHGTGHVVTMEGRQRERERNALDFADLYGHVSHDSRSLYGGGAFERARQQEDSLMGYNTASPSSSRPAKWEREEQQQWGRPLPTLGSLLATLRACLSFCPRIRVLSLNGFLERAVGGTRECVGLSELRHLSLGPPPAYWSSALHLHHKALSSVRTVHISGCMLFKSEAMALGGFTNALPNLQQVDWTLLLSHIVEHPITLVDTLSYILGHGSTAIASHLEQVKRRRPLKVIRATLNPSDVTCWMQNAKEEVKKDHRLILQECNPNQQDINIRAVREWWEKKAGIY